MFFVKRAKKIKNGAVNLQNIHSVFFSPTETTRMVVQAVVRGITKTPACEQDITLHTFPPGRQLFDKDELLIIGAPVYAGRIPGLATRRLKRLHGNRTPVIAITVFGNRAYDDALLELCDQCTAQGFSVIGAGAFVGQHSFSSLEHPIAHDRPDEKDLLLAETFGGQIRQMLRNAGSAEHLQSPQIPGQRPYKPGMQHSCAAGGTDPEICKQCGQCALHCPAQIIHMNGGTPVTDQDNCLWCTACVRHCPTGARKIMEPKISEIANRLYSTCKPRKEPEWFLASALNASV
jgi:ferredoxin